MLVLLHTSQFRSFGKCVKSAVLSRYQAACLMPRFVQRLSSSTKSSANSSSHSSRSRNGSSRAQSLSPFFMFVFGFLRISKLVSQRWAAFTPISCACGTWRRISCLGSCNTNIADVLAVELEDPVDTPRTTESLSR